LIGIEVDKHLLGHRFISEVGYKYPNGFQKERCYLDSIKALQRSMDKFFETNPTIKLKKRHTSNYGK